MPPTLPSQPVAASSDTDIYSITDAHLAQRYQFIREIGAGNWGCVWLCAPKTDESHGQAVVDDPRRRVAVKLVFREKKPTTAQRVRSLWNEMKIVRALKQDPHPSIIPFHSFIITPSFAIITMEYLPHLVPVEVPECKAREWFRTLLSAVSFLHGRGVVHNDIKPANILLSTKNVPVFVDFGFAERYEIGSKRAFLSNLAYGTPEYLSPERARGNVHDTRKSDMWSLGIAFFEILVGRTPFEYVEGEKFTTPEDLERYWSRTVKGKWVGEWKMSKPAERLLLRMISPNADIRYTASQAMGDVYWSDESDAEVLSDAQEESSVPASVRTPRKVKGVERKTSTPLNRENIRTPASTPKRIPAADDAKARVTARAARRAQQQVLPSIEGSPLSPKTAGWRENTSPIRYAPRAAAHKGHVPVTRKPVPSGDRENRPPVKGKDAATRESETKERTKKNRVLLDRTDRSRNVQTPKKIGTVHARGKTEKVEKVKQADPKRLGSGSYDRVKAFERLKQMERSRFLEEEDEEDEVKEGQEISISPKPSSQLDPTPSTAGLSTKVDARSVLGMSFERPRTADSSFTMLSSEPRGRFERRPSEGYRPVEDPRLLPPNPLPRPGNDSSLSLFKQNFKSSIDKTLGRYRSSTLDHTSTWKASRQASEDHETELGIGHRESWENDSLIRDAKSSLPVVRHALHNEQVAADNKYDRLSLWVRNVEQVVQEAKETFASSTITPLPPLPARPVQRPASTRNVRPSRVPRKILPADQIFQVDAADSALSSNVPSTGCISPEKMSINIGAMLASPLEGLDFGLPTSSPRARRATVSATSPVLAAKTALTDSFDGSPSERKEKAKSSGNLASLVRPISPMSQIQKELEKGENSSIPNISDVLDRSIFIAGNGSTLPLQEDSFIPNISPPEANRKSSTLGPSNSPPTTNILRESSSSPILTSPHRRHIEGVYDRFLMAATGVKRVGRGYQSDMSAPAQMLPSLGAKKNSKIFSGRRPIRSVVSKDDLNKSGGVDDFGKFMTASYSSMSSHRDDANKSVRAVAKAFKAIVTGKTVARRQSKVL